jgi:hypothetical protein
MRDAAFGRGEQQSCAFAILGASRVEFLERLQSRLKP